MKGFDFTDCVIRKKVYGGANGEKLSIMIGGKLYMLKFPSKSSRNKNLSYLNGTTSEYLGCHIFETFDILVQKTLLGISKSSSGKVKVAVACEDFCTDGRVLQDFASLRNSVVDSLSGGKSTELSDIMEVIDKQSFFDADYLRNYFWDVFIVDSLIGNWDRHNGNWGFLYDEKNDNISIAPVYDCGSSMYPSADDETMKEVIRDENALKYRIYEIPTSAIKLNEKRIRYFDFINSLSNRDCNKALLRIYPKIDIGRINSIIENTPYVSDLRKDFLKLMMQKRIELILKPAYDRLRIMSMPSGIGNNNGNKPASIGDNSDPWSY